MPAVHEQVMDAAVAALVAMGLEQFPENKIVKQITFDETNLPTRPCIVVLLDSVREELTQIDTENDKRVFPVHVILIDRKSRTDHTWVGDWLTWRETIASAFLSQVLEDVDGTWDLDIKAMQVIDAQRLLGPAYQDARGGFTIEATCDTDRTRPDEE